MASSHSSKLGLKLKRSKDQPKKNFKGTGLRIVDDDSDFSYSASRRTLYSSKPNLDSWNNADKDEDDDDEHNDAEELPQIAGVIDERPLEIQSLERFSAANKWKQVGSNSNDESNNTDLLLSSLAAGNKNSRVEEPVVPSSLKHSRVEIEDDTASIISSASSVKRTLDGKRAGLQNASALREEMIAHRKRENAMFAKMDASISGRNAETKVRDRRSAKEREADDRKKEEEEKFNKERKEKYDRWGKGLKQVESRQDKISEALHEMSKPLARYKDDEDLDAHLRAQERDGDPMLAMLSRKKSKRSGEPSRPKYSGPQPLPNRFKIQPGYRWDGVDRSNGYEKEWFSKINSRKALEEEAYKWSVEDL